MDSDRFDDLSRQLARPRSRREALGLLGAAVAGIITGRSASAAPREDKPSKCYGGGSSCTNAKQCCSGICTNRRCEPEIPPECSVAGDCPGADTECEVRTCIAGVCGTQDIVAGTDCSAGVCNGNGQCVECLADIDCESGLCENGACTPTCLTDDRLGDPCTAGEGACLRSGFYVCAPDGLGVVCDAVAGTGSPETCNGIDDDCDGEVDEGAICPSVNNGNFGCVAGDCLLQSCNPGFDDCDNIPQNGCETNLGLDPRNCGACGHICPAAPNGFAICSQGNCGLQCVNGYHSCNIMAPGCECPPAGVCRGTSCCITSGPVHPTIPCCSGFSIGGLCVG